jgi:hypothetical protein
VAARGGSRGQRESRGSRVGSGWSRMPWLRWSPRRLEAARECGMARSGCDTGASVDRIHNNCQLVCYSAYLCLHNTGSVLSMLSVMRRLNWHHCIKETETQFQFDNSGNWSSAMLRPLSLILSVNLNAMHM